MLSRLLPLFALTAILLLQGCGFHLRGEGELPAHLSPLHIQGPGEFHPMRRDLESVLTAAGVEVTDQRAGAAAILRLSEPDEERRVLSVDGRGKVVEYELHTGWLFDLVDAAGTQLVPDQRVGVERTYINPEDEVLGKNFEEDQLRRDMRLDLAGRILARLQAQLR